MSIVVHSPHASVLVPDDVRSQFCVSSAEIDRELILMTDRFTDDLFCLDIPGVDHLLYDASRLVVDPERFRSDADETMAQRGMGAVYMRTAHGRALRYDLTDYDREALLIRLYDPHHKALDDMVKAALDAVGKCLILDAHSFPSVPLPCDVDQSPGRPDICIGTDGFHTPDELVLAVRDIFTKRGFDAAVNRPYSGTIVPISFWRRDNRVLSLMIEVNRTLYMDEETGAKIDTYGDFRKTLQECLLGIKKFYDRRLSGDYIGGNDIE